MLAIGILAREVRAEDRVDAERVFERLLESAAVSPHRERIGQRRDAVGRVAEQPRLAEIGAGHVRRRDAVAGLVEAGVVAGVERVVEQSVAPLSTVRSPIV